MAPKKHKQATNAYYYFMLHIQNRHPGKRISLAEASRLAQTEWERMSAEQRAPFQKLAKDEKERQKGSGEKFTSQGLSFAELDKEKEMQNQKIESMRKAVKERIEMALINDSLVQEDFFFIDINIFCEVYEKDYEMFYYYPAEIGISKYTLAEGISKTYYSAINPGRVKTGYVRTAKQHSEETHQLPIPPDAIGETDMEVIFKAVIKFLKDNCNNKSVVPFLYTLPNQIPIVEGVLYQWCDSYNVPIDFKVFSLPELFMYLMNASATSKDKFDTPTIAQLAIEKDVYDYYRGLACEYHEATDVLHMCSLSKVKRWGFIISDYCLQFFPTIEIIMGQHLPKQADSKLLQNNMNSRCESRAESEFTTVSRKLQAKSSKQNAVWGTTAPSQPPRLQHKNQTGATKKVPIERPGSPTESMASYISNMSINSNDRYQDNGEFTTNLMDFPLLNNRHMDAVSSVGTIEPVRRPKTQSEMKMSGAANRTQGQTPVTGAAALLGYSTDTSVTENSWSNIAKKRTQSKGRGRGIAAKFSNS